MENNILYYYYDKENKNIIAPLYKNLIQTIISEEKINLSNEKVIIFEDENENRIENENDYNILIRKQSKIIVKIEDKILNSINKIIDNHFNPMINAIKKNNLQEINNLKDINKKLRNIETNFNSSIQNIEQSYQKMIKEKENDESMYNQNIKQNNDEIIINIKNKLNNNIDEFKKINFSKFNENLEIKLDENFNSVKNSFNNILNLVKDINNDIYKFPIEKKQNFNALIVVPKDSYKIPKETIMKGRFKIKIEIKNNGNDFLPANCTIEGKSNNLYCNTINLEQNINEGTNEIYLTILSRNINTINNTENFEIKLYDPQKKEIHSCNITIEITGDDNKNIKNIIPDFNKINKENEKYEKKLIQRNEFEKNIRIDGNFAELNERIKELGIKVDAEVLRNHLISSEGDVDEAVNDILNNLSYIKKNN